MKLLASKPIYLKGDVVLVGHTFETDEQHGRELIKKGYAVVFQEPENEDLKTAIANAKAEAEAKAIEEANAAAAAKAEAEAKAIEEANAAAAEAEQNVKKK